MYMQKLVLTWVQAKSVKVPSIAICHETLQEKGLESREYVTLVSHFQA